MVFVNIVFIKPTNKSLLIHDDTKDNLDNNNQYKCNINRNKSYPNITFVNGLTHKIIKILHTFNINEIRFSMTTIKQIKRQN